MPADAWLLLIASVGLGLGVEVLYMRARRRDRSLARTDARRRAGEQGL